MTHQFVDSTSRTGEARISKAPAARGPIYRTDALITQKLTRRQPGTSIRPEKQIIQWLDRQKISSLIVFSQALPTPNVGAGNTYAAGPHGGDASSAIDEPGQIRSVTPAGLRLQPAELAGRARRHEPGPDAASEQTPRQSGLARQPALSAAQHHGGVLGRQRHCRTARRWSHPASDAFVPALVAAFLIILPFAWILVRDWPAIRGRLGIMIVLSITGIGAFNTLQYWASSIPRRSTRCCCNRPGRCSSRCGRWCCSAYG